MKCFLSHSSKDKEWFVRQVYDRLEGAAIIDECDFRAATYTKDEIIEHILECNIFVYFISKNSLESGWVQDEVKLAEELCRNGEIKLFLPIILDSDIDFSDERFSPWLREHYNLKYLGGPKYVAKRIRDEIFFLKLKLRPELREESKLCLGRSTETDSFVHRYENFMSVPLKMVIASGISQIGRKTFLRNLLSASQLRQSSFKPIEIVLNSRSGIEDLIERLEPVSDEVDKNSIDSMLTKTMDEKISIALRMICELSKRNEIILIDDENCVVDYTGKMAQWFEKILDDDLFPKGIVFLIAAKRSLFLRRDDIMCIPIVELKYDDTVSIFSRILRIRGKSLSQDSMKFWTNLMVGHPGQIKHTINILEQYQYDEILAQKQSFLVLNYLTDQAAITLNTHITDPIKSEILRFFAKAEFASFDLFNSVFTCEKHKQYLREFICCGILEFVGDNHEFIRLSGVFRDYVLRNTRGFSPETQKILRKLTKEYINSADQTSYDDVSSNSLFATQALEFSEDIDIRRLFPTHIITAMVNIYNAGDDYKRVIKLADNLLAYRNNIAENTVRDVLYYKCLAMARLQDRNVLKEVKMLPADQSAFIKGFYYRRIGRATDAIRELRQIINVPFIGHRARREIVLALQQMEQYDEALELAQENYNQAPNNHYHVQALFKCLVYSSRFSVDDVAKQKARRLVEELKHFGSEQAMEMSLLASAQYVAFIEENYTKANDLISDAMAKNPDSKYPVLVQMDVALRHGLFTECQKAMDDISKYISTHPNVPQRIFLRQKAYFKSACGKMREALEDLREELDRLDSSAKHKLLSKIQSFDQHRLRQL